MTLFLALALVSFDADIVPGFEDPVVYEAVMSGQIKVQQLTATDSESSFVIRGFFPKTSPDLYVDLATDHQKYPVMFNEIKEARTTSVNADRTLWTYFMDIVVKYLFITEHIKPEGRQAYTRAPDAISEAVLTHTVDNYGDTLKTMVERTRLIPHDDGILVHDYVSYSLHKPTSWAGVVREKLKEQFVRFMTVYRQNLSGG